MGFINRFGALTLSIVITVFSCIGIFTGYSFVKDSCIVHEAERSDEDIKKSEYIVYGTSADIFPLSYINRTFSEDDCRYITNVVLSDNKYSTQIDVLYAQNIAKAMGMPLKIAYIPRGELIESLDSGKIDIVSSFALNESYTSSVSSSSPYYKVKPVLVFGDEGCGTFNKVDSIHVYSDSKLESVVDKSQISNASWKKVSTYDNLVSGLSENTAYLTELSCVGDNHNYKELNVKDSAVSECRFIYRTENVILGQAIEEAISRVNQSGERHSVIEQSSVVNEISSENTQTDGFDRKEVMRTFMGNNFANGSEVFSGENGSFFVALDNKLYHYDSSAKLINTYNDYIVGDEAFAIDQKIYTIDQNDKTVCRVLDLQTNDASHITLEKKYSWFKSSSFRKARKLLKDESEIMPYEDFVKLIGMFASNGIFLLEENYIWKNWDTVTKEKMLRYDMKKKQTENYTETMSLLGIKHDFEYNVYEGKAYAVDGCHVICYDFNGDAKTIASEPEIGNVLSFIIDSDGIMFAITKNNENYEVYRWKLYGFCDRIYSGEIQLTNIYESGNYIIVYTDNAFLIMEKTSGSIVEKVGGSK